jgi:hypothetical protein
MEEYRKVKTLHVLVHDVPYTRINHPWLCFLMQKLRSAMKKPIKETGKFGGRQLLAAIVTKWGVPYDIQIRTSAALGEGSENVYAHIMWSYYGQKSFAMRSKVYMEHLEAVAQYISAVGKVDLFRDKVAMCRKRPNAYFGYAVTIPLDVPPSTVAPFFKMLE